MKSSVVSFVLLCFCVGTLSAGRLYIDIPAYSTCKPPKGDVCIEIRQCPFFDDLLNRSSIPRPRSIINIIRDHQCGFVGNTPYVCCNRPTPPPHTTEISTTPLPLFDQRTNVLSEHMNAELLPNDICGPISTNSRITSGTKTEIGEYPWMALIAYYTNEGLDFRCGGTVINERYVLTAAHCILNSTIVGVRLGENNLETIEDCDSQGVYCAPPTQDFYIEEIIVHPGYNSKTYANDIALIRLATSANFNSSNVQPICLPMEEMELNGKFAIIAGWGVTESGHRSSELMKASLPVLPISECQRNYKRFAIITSKQICAGGYKGKDSCGGDSGGPMKYVSLVDGIPRFIQHGIVSYGPRHCGSRGQPAIYTRVFKYMDWILDNLKPSLDD